MEQVPRCLSLITQKCLNRPDRRDRGDAYRVRVRRVLLKTGKTVLNEKNRPFACSEKNLNEATLLEIMSLIHRHTPEFDERLFN